ncbi:MAG: VWA domain-containing protein [Bryobacterales bacterium]|jgi:hypothetical protein|nr:VWA domain-containing protein [Bryobacterales bacterium]
MEFLNLNLLQLLAAAGGISAFVVALYFLDRRRRRVVVSSLRFWHEARAERHPLPQKRIQQPWSLLLQLLGLLALLAALGDIRWTANSLRALDHVLVLDTSSWMQARDANGLLLDRAKAQAIRWVRSLPPGDRVLLVLSDANPMPAGSFEEDLALVEAAIGNATAGPTALQLGEALGFARQMLSSREASGDIVFVGSRWIAEEEIPSITSELSNLRVIAVDGAWRNVYLDRVTLQPKERDAGGWTAFVSVGNRGPAAQVPIQLRFGGAPTAAATVRVPSDEVVTAPIEFRIGAAGWVDVRLEMADMVRADNFARVEVPRTSVVQVQVCTQSPTRYASLFRANPGWNPIYRQDRPCAISPDAELLVLDDAVPVGALTVPALWIEPPANSPFPSREANVAGNRVQWNTQSALAQGLQAKDLALTRGRYLERSSGDEVVAEMDGKPLAIARPSGPPQVAWGFQPLASDLRFEVATPLLFANSFRWLLPSTSIPEELRVGSMGAVLITDLDGDAEEAPRVVDARGNALPVSKAADGWRFFAGSGGMYQVRQGQSERMVSLTLPQAPRSFWEPTAEQLVKAIPANSGAEAPRRWWMWLTVFGLLCLVADALLFDRRGEGEAPRALPNPLTPLLAPLRNLLRKEARPRHGV